MTDNHVHIGQFYENYYEPLDVMRIVFDAGIEGVFFSSTTSAKEAVRYGEVENEMESVFVGLGNLVEKVRALCWYIPDYAKQGVTVKAALESLPYSGIKIHPRANSWDLSDTNMVEIANALFDYADCHELPVLIHTGYDDIDRADKFERFFAEYHRAKITLAHCRPLDTAIEMLRRYKNVFCDTAFVPLSDIQRITDAGFAARILTGSDFPVTHYFRTKYLREGQNAPLTLPEQYVEDVRKMKASQAKATEAI
jgi:predicted TIM-barrel fold metal-dependent hydrolase